MQCELQYCIFVYYLNYYLFFFTPSNAQQRFLHTITMQCISVYNCVPWPPVAGEAGGSARRRLLDRLLDGLLDRVLDRVLDRLPWREKPAAARRRPPR